MKPISAKDFFADALRYRPHRATPNAIITATPARNKFTPGLWFADGNEKVLGNVADFPHEEADHLQPQKGDAVVNAWTKSKSGIAYMHRLVIPKQSFDADYIKVGGVYRLRPFKKKLAPENMLLTNKGEVEFIAEGSDLVWRGGKFSYETNPLLPGLCVPIMAGAPLFENVNAAYNKAGIPSLMPTINSDASISTRLNEKGKPIDPFNEIRNTFIQVHDAIQKDEHRLRLAPNFMSEFEAHKKALHDRYVWRTARELEKQSYAQLRNHRL